MKFNLLFPALAVLLLAPPACAASFSVTHPYDALYSTSRASAEWNFTIEFSDVSCGAGVEQAFTFILPQWYMAPMPEDINAFLRIDENTLRYVSCTRSTGNPRVVVCNVFVDGNKLADFASLTILLAARTNDLEGNPARTEMWGAGVMCNPAYAPTKTELSATLDVLAPEVEISYPVQGMAVSGTTVFSVSESKGIPHYVRFKLTQTSAIVPEMSDSNRAGGWAVLFDTTTVQDGSVVLKVYACDQSLNCSEPKSVGFEISNPEQPGVDLIKPHISSNVPVGETALAQPVVGAIVSDNNAVNLETVRLYIDGSAVVYNLNPVSKVLYAEIFYTPQAPLTEGAHTALVEAEDYSGNKASLEWKFTIAQPEPAPEPVPEPAAEPAQNKPPEIFSITAIPETAAAEQDIVFTAVVGDESQENLSYTWAFGDGAVSREKKPGHAYSLPKGVASRSFPVTLYVSDGEFTSTFSTTVFVVKPQATGASASGEPQVPEGLPDGRLFSILPAAALAAIIAAVALAYLAFFSRKSLRKYLGKGRRERFSKPEAILPRRLKKQKERHEPEAKKGAKLPEAPLPKIELDRQKPPFDALAKPAELEKKLKGKISESEAEEVRRLVFLLREQGKRYSRAELVHSILGEGYSEKVAEKVVEVLHSGKKN